MERTPKLIIGMTLAALVSVGLLVYAYLQSRDFLRGPVITITEPRNGSVATSSFITLSGKARNVAFLTLNSRQIFTDERGNFSESLLLPEGYSIMTIEAKDRFGHVAQKRLELVYKPEHDTNATNIPSE